jgi:hypothetical protein
MPVLNFRDAEEFDPETYGGEGAGGLLGRLQAIVQPGQVQPGADWSAASKDAPEFNAGTFDSPQGGLFGRLMALQAEQSQYQPDNNGAVPPERTFSDRLKAWWDHPHPYGLIRMFKEAANGMEQAVQGSIDATIVPTTEEEAFRQRMGHELAAIGALKALSLRAPLPPNTSGFLRGLANLAVSRGASSAVAGINPWSPKAADDQGQSTGGPVNVDGGLLSQWPFP